MLSSLSSTNSVSSKGYQTYQDLRASPKIYPSGNDSTLDHWHGHDHTCLELARFFYQPEVLRNLLFYFLLFTLPLHTQSMSKPYQFYCQNISRLYGLFSVSIATALVQATIVLCLDNCSNILATLPFFLLASLRLLLYTAV